MRSIWFCVRNSILSIVRLPRSFHFSKFLIFSMGVFLLSRNVQEMKRVFYIIFTTYRKRAWMEYGTCNITRSLDIRKRMIIWRSCRFLAVEFRMIISFISHESSVVIILMYSYAFILGSIYYVILKWRTQNVQFVTVESEELLYVSLV